MAHDPSDDGLDSATSTLIHELPDLKPLGAMLRVIEPAGLKPHRLASGKCIIGSAPTSNFVVAHPTVSRTHVELELVPDGVRVADLGSRNGTHYLGQRIERAVLSLGSRIKVGAAEIAIDADTESLEEGAAYPDDEYRNIVGASYAMRRIFATLERLEGSLVTVLVEGESGVGKELIARALHEGSEVFAGPLVVVNCGAIPRDLVASELFGHRRGAFTGAVEARKGAFESADGGTLFLDEIGELPLDVQPMLLRVLETGELRAVGADGVRRVRVRVVAATHRMLEEEVEAGRFREDLFYRLAVVRVRIPPLRERPEDIEPIARRLAEQAGVKSLPPQIIEQLKSRTFRGNVRELRNVVQAYAALGYLPGDKAAASEGALAAALSAYVDLDRPFLAQKEALVEEFTTVYLRALLSRTQGNQSAAARISGLDRTYLGRLLARHGLGKR
ncbi:sigma 54-interacting transcriptional regulator [Pendulispora albinea]|uniref:Sigma 54-interacting transcriptional regulator n=1 Tax=Pendulispora albinea TaxID=2741071 RepID=A0ABZ2M2M9_9BACT